MFKRKALLLLVGVGLLIGVGIQGWAIQLVDPPSWAVYSSPYVLKASTSDVLWFTGDYDYFRTTLYGGTSYKITITGPYNADFDLKVYDGNWHLVASSTGNGSSETVHITPIWTGTFHIKVYSYSGSGVYTVRLYRRI